MVYAKWNVGADILGRKSEKTSFSQKQSMQVRFTTEARQESDDRVLFDRFLKEWQHETRFVSSVKAVTSHPSFLQIVNMGGNAVPFILKEIERQPSNLVWALNAIFHKKIGNGGTVTEACRLWIAELKK